MLYCSIAVHKSNATFSSQADVSDDLPKTRGVKRVNLQTKAAVNALSMRLAWLASAFWQRSWPVQYLSCKSPQDMERHGHKPPQELSETQRGVWCFRVCSHWWSKTNLSVPREVRSGPYFRNFLTFTVEGVQSFYAVLSMFKIRVAVAPPTCYH